MKKVILYCLSLMIVLVAAGAIALKTVNPNDYKQDIVEAVRNSTGRTLKINGDIKAELSFSPGLSISDVSLSNPGWSKIPQMAKAAEVSVKVALWPLFFKELRFKQVLVKNAEISLEVSEDGENNWTFDKTVPAPLPKSAVKTVSKNEKSGEKSGEGFKFKKVGIDSIVFENTVLSYANRQKNKSYVADFSSASLFENKDGMHLAMQTNVLGTPVSVNGKFDHLSVLSQGSKPFNAIVEIGGTSFQAVLNGNYTKKTRQMSGELRIKGSDIAKAAAMLNAKVPDLKDFEAAAYFSGTGKNIAVSSFYASAGQAGTFLAKASGRIASLQPLNGLEGKISVSAPDVSGVSGWEDYTFAPIQFSADVSADADSYALRNISFKASQSDLSGSISFSASQQAPSFNIKLNSGLLNLADLIREKGESFVVSAKTLDGQTAPASFGNPNQQNPNQQNQPVVVKAKGSVFSSKPLPFDMLKKADGNIDIEISKLIGADETDLGAVSLRASLKDGVFSLPSFAIADVLSFSTKMDASNEDAATVGASLRITNLPLTLFFAKKGVSAGSVSADIRFGGRGDSAKTIASSLNGKILFTVSGLVFKNSLTTDWGRFMPEGLSDKDGNLTTQCIVVNTPINKGVISSNGQAAFEALPLMGQLNAKIDLSSERLNGNLILASAKPSLWSALTGTAKLSGTLRRPSLRMSPQGILDNAVSYGIAFLVGGKKAAEQAVATKLVNPCKTALNGGISQKQQEKTKAETPVSEPLSSNPEADEMIRNLDGVLNRIFGAPVRP